LVGPRRFDVVEEDVASPAAGQVRVRILACGVCASELHAWHGPLDAYPVRIGHEPVGVVEELGPGVTTVAAGDAVTGRFGPAFADRVNVDVGALVPVPAELDPLDALAEPLGCVMEARRRTPLSLGDRVAIVGAGYMGLLMLDLLRISGVGHTLIVDPRPDALEVGRSLGASEAVAPDELAEREADETFEVVVEATGVQAGLDLATRLVRQHGVITLLGYHHGPPRSIDVESWNWKAIDVINGHVRRRDLLNEGIRRGLELMRLGRIAPQRLVTHRFDLPDVGRAFEALESKPEGFMKAVVVM
jgi:threonine dehydrogenase-like Zn-dependent dehydrogenase